METPCFSPSLMNFRVIYNPGYNIVELYSLLIQGQFATIKAILDI